MKLPQSAIDVIERVRLGFVATVTPGGRPAVSPKGTFVVLDEQTIAFGEIRSPGTMSNLSHTPEVEINFVDSFTRKGCRVRGATRILRKGTGGYAELVHHWVETWGDLERRMNAIVLVDVAEVKPLSSPPYDDGATEQEMIATYKAKFAEMYP